MAPDERIVIVSNRGPVTFQDDGSVKRGTGGLVTALTGPVFVMTVCLLVVIMGNTTLNVAIPTLQRELGASQGQLQWAIDAYILVFAGLLFSWGVIGDRIGLFQRSIERAVNNLESEEWSSDAASTG